MAKYSDGFKFNVVKEYLEGSLVYRLLAKKHNIPNKQQVRKWVKAYKNLGKEGLKRKRSNTVYPVQFKLGVLTDKIMEQLQEGVIPWRPVDQWLGCPLENTASVQGHQ
ncbi:transposase [Alteribacillus sp. HJP-4]|uniref:transposase n=1 Tax=Alteribacillus sp. HJP-4 TaxID=2775394 RepID=UPI0035CCD8AE